MKYANGCVTKDHKLQTVLLPLSPQLLIGQIDWFCTPLTELFGSFVEVRQLNEKRAPRSGSIFVRYF